MAFACSDLSALHQRCDMKAAKHRPDDAIVVLIGQVEVFRAVILTPVAVARIDRRVAGF